MPTSDDDSTRTASLVLFDLTREIADSYQKKPWHSGIHSRTLCKEPDFRVVLICMETAARLKEHKVDGTSSVHVLQGRIRYSAQGRTYDLRAGSLITVAASIPHDVEALDESVFLLTIAWPH
jgi:quercetin dioxygenase-like cupin family protein